MTEIEFEWKFYHFSGLFIFSLFFCSLARTSSFFVYTTERKIEKYTVSSYQHAPIPPIWQLISSICGREWMNGEKFTSIELIYWIVKKIRGRESESERTVVRFDYPSLFMVLSMSTHTRIHANFRSNVIYWMMMTKNMKKTKKKKTHIEICISIFFFR